MEMEQGLTWGDDVGSTISHFGDPKVEKMSDCMKNQT